MIAFWIFCALFPGVVCPYNPIFDNNFVPSQPPSWAHPFGTDTHGRDVFSRVLAGSGHPAVSIAATLIGSVSERHSDCSRGTSAVPSTTWSSRLIDAVLALPLIVIGDRRRQSRVGNSGRSVVTLVIGFVFTPIVARTVGRRVLAERELDYVQAARLRGERAPLHHVRGDPPERDGARSSSRPRCGWATRCSPSRRSRSWVSASSRRRPTGRADLGALQLIEQALVDGAVAGPRDRLARRRAQPRGRRLQQAVEDERRTTRDARARARVRDLDVAYRVRGSDRAGAPRGDVRGPAGHSYGLVGESGCGKSTVALAIVRYLPRNGRGQRGLGPDRRRGRARARRAAACGSCAATKVSMVYQNPGAALNPRCGSAGSSAEVFALRGVEPRRGAERSLGALSEVQIADPGRVMAPVSAPALRRHAAARRDRDGARERTRRC